MRLVFVNRFFYPDHSATSQMLSDLVFGLRETRSDIHVVTSRLLYDDTKIRLASEEEIAGVRVHRVWTSRFGRGTPLGRFFDYLTFYLPAFFYLLKVLRVGDVAIAKTDPPLLSIAVWCAVRWRRALLVNWVQDVFPEVAIAAGVRGVRGPVARALTWLRDLTMKPAAVNVVLSPRMADLFRARGIPDRSLAVIANWADGNAIRPLPAADNPLRLKWGLNGKFIAGYSGNLGRVYEFDTILDAAELLQTDPSIVFLFVGSGLRHERVQAEALRRRLPNVVFKPYQPREELAYSIPLPDVHLVSLLPVMEGFILPSKFYGAIAAGRPIIFIGDRDGELAEEIARYDCGFAVEPNDFRRLADVLRQLCRQPAISHQLGRNARIAFENNFDKSHAILKWNALLSDLDVLNA